MNYFQKLYANQYLELKANGKEAAARQNGTQLNAVVVLLYVAGLFFLLLGVAPQLFEGIEDGIEMVLGRNSGRGVGRLIGLLILGIIYLIVRATLGKEAYYQKTVDAIEALDPAAQKKASQEGLYYFVSGFVAFGLGLLMFVVFS